MAPATGRSDEQFHLTGMRTPVLADLFPASKPETDVCPHKDALPTDVGHANSFEKSGGVFTDARALRTVKIRCLPQDVLCMGWFGRPLFTSPKASECVNTPRPFSWQIKCVELAPEVDPKSGSEPRP
jgi:hypothetical protein